MELAESEAEEKIEKKIKPNPAVEKEINVFPNRNNNNKMLIEEPAPQTFPAFSQPVNINVLCLEFTY